MSDMDFNAKKVEFYKRMADRRRNPVADLMAPFMQGEAIVNGKRVKGTITSTAAKDGAKIRPEDQIVVKK